MKDSLGDRMKGNYEDRYRISLPRRTNIIIRIDGKAFHSYTRGLERPFDQGLSDDMDATTKFLCENIQGAKMGYVQSDEISILVTDYDDLSTNAWFDNNLQKMCSISASLATSKFNQLRLSRRFRNMLDPEMEIDVNVSIAADMIEKFKSAQFDSRIMIIPESEEVVNYFIWRQQDATRNSISMAAQSMFSHKELQGKSTSNMQDMMMLQKSVNWNDYPTRFKRGTAVIKVTDLYKRIKGSKTAGEIVPPEQAIDAKQAVGILGDQSKYELYERSSWKAVETPIFTQEREFILNTFNNGKS
jgi:tRNA(His) 5'-end guanylyltransferase